MWDRLDVIVAVVLAVLDIGISLAVTIHIVLQKVDSRAAISWTGLVWLTPFVGTLLYACFGINRIQRKATALRVGQHWKHHSQITLNTEELVQREHFIADQQNLVGLANVVRRLTGRDLVPGNQVVPLIDGDAAFPAMLEAIDSAKRSISLCTYIFDDDRVGNQFCQALERAHQRQVEVRVLIDGIGVRYSRESTVRRLRRAGVSAAAFLPTPLPRLFRYANLRNHRKILVVDGARGFTGGTNIREGHQLNLQPAYPVRCVHFEVAGPVVSQMQEVFAIDWAFVTGESLQGEAWFPPLTRAGSVWSRGIADGPDEDFEKLTDTLIAAVSVAKKFVRIVTPYFLPEASLVRALSVAAMRGVDVRIYLPSTNNITLVQWASTGTWEPLLEKGCRIFLMPPPFDHSKLMVVDGTWSLIGSTNWDPRSLRLNFEFNLECYGETFTESILTIVSGKARSAREITLDQVQSRPFPIRLRDGIARLATPYL